MTRPEDLACLFVPVPRGSDLIAEVEAAGGVPLIDGVHGPGFELARDVPPPGASPLVVSAAGLEDAQLRAAAVRPDVVGVRFEELDEERLLGLRDLEDELAVLVPGRAFASGWRLGATGAIAPELLAAPAAFGAFCARCDEDLGWALQAERRMQHLLETSFEPLARRAGWSEDERVAAFAVASGWRAEAFPPQLHDELAAFGQDLARALGGAA